MSGFDERRQRPGFEQVLGRLRYAVEKNPELRERIDSDERSFCEHFDRIEKDMLKSKLDCYQAGRPEPPPRRGPSPEEEARQRGLDRAKAEGGSPESVGRFLDRFSTPKEEAK